MGAKKICMIIILGLMSFLAYTLVNIDTDSLIDKYFLGDFDEEQANFSDNKHSRSSKKKDGSSKNKIKKPDVVELAVVGCKGPHKDSVGKYHITTFIYYF